MQAGTFQDIYTDFGSLSTLRGMSKGDQAPEALRTVARQFEGVFVQMMLKSMRDASLGNPLFDNDSTELYRDMLDKQLASDIAQSNSMGIADMLVSQLKGFISKSGPSGELSPPAPHRLGERAGFSSRSAPVTERAPAFSTPAEFIDTLLPEAKNVAERHGLDPKLLVAQAALETGWGSALMQRQDGRSAFNLFGIKADARWSGDKTLVDTLEYSGGVAVKERAAFRAYSSFAESFDDYVRFLNANPRYSNALANADNPNLYMQELQAAGYATDPRYADKVLRILDEEIHPHVARLATHAL